MTREELKQELISRQMVDPTKAGFALAVISLQMGMLKNDFLRQGNQLRVSRQSVGER